MALAMKSIPVGITYAIWAGLGLLLLVVFSALIYKQIPDTPAILGVIFICLGIFIIQLFSNMIHGKLLCFKRSTSDGCSTNYNHIFP